MTKTTMRYLAALGILLGAAACSNDELFHNSTMDPVNPLFTRYASMGNSITAGFQSGGINDSTQIQAYPVLLAKQMHSPFWQPLLNRPGCTPPIVSVFSNPQTYVGGATASTCAFRESQTPEPPYINDVAVPGAYAFSVTNNLPPQAHSNPLTTFFLGGLTQMQMLKRVNPTFFTAWVGNNDVLTAATAGGDTTLVTDTAAFEASYKAMLDSVASPTLKGGVLLGVANVTLVPFFSKGSTYFALKNGLVPGAPPLPATFIVLPACAPGALGGIGDSVLVPFPFGIPLIAAAAAGATDTLACTETATVQPAELRKLVATVTTYNAFIQAQATARGYGYFDPNALFTSLPAGSIPAFPTISGASAVTAPFGNYFTRDGIHPSGLAHKLVANGLIQVINTKYGTALPAIP